MMEWLFVAACCVAVAAHVYATRFFLPMWAAGFREHPEHEGYGRKALIGYGIFIGAMAVGFAAGGVAELAGGWN